jgi:hypothetical protein
LTTTGEAEYNEVARTSESRVRIGAIVSRCPVSM